VRDTYGSGGQCGGGDWPTVTGGELGTGRMLCLLPYF